LLFILFSILIFLLILLFLHALSPERKNEDEE